MIPEPRIGEFVDGPDVGLIEVEPFRSTSAANVVVHDDHACELTSGRSRGAACGSRLERQKRPPPPRSLLLATDLCGHSPPMDPACQCGLSRVLVVARLLGRAMNGQTIRIAEFESTLADRTNA